MEGNKLCVLVSACLLGENCKFNGGNNDNQAVKNFLTNNQAVPICPELLAGLPTPRPPAEIVNGRVTEVTGQDVHERYQLGVREAMELIKDQSIDLAILQSCSPTCGVNQVYDGQFVGRKISGSGLFAQTLRENGYRVIDAEDIK